MTCYLDNKALPIEEKCLTILQAAIFNETDLKARLWAIGAFAGIYYYLDLRKAKEVLLHLLNDPATDVRDKAAEELNLFKEFDRIAAKYGG